MKTALSNATSSQAIGEWLLAENELVVTQALDGMGLRRKAAVSAYYTAFHMANALLWSVGVEPRSHEGTQTMLSLHFVKPGILPSGTAHQFNVLMAERHQADYDAITPLDDNGASESIARAFKLASDMVAAACNLKTTPSEALPVVARIHKALELGCSDKPTSHTP